MSGYYVNKPPVGYGTKSEMLMMRDALDAFFDGRRQPVFYPEGLAEHPFVHKVRIRDRAHLDRLLATLRND